MTTYLFHIFEWSVLDAEFDEPPSETELLEGMAHGHLNAAHEFRSPQTSWANYYAHPRYMESRHYHTSFEDPLPLELIIYHMVEEFSNLKPRGEFKYRSARQAEEEYLIAKKALRESHVGA